ncbi:hypothetical protein BDE36_3568 [Arcticibacter tournemirensis]|uniref:Uncharacterized protein n=1 Tax=Arcticibacter tournemirensis TaxID=699437 RepID=A0A5M9HFC8_9SPHI|nr:hypothetical protein [Arcticibacter tournemirensis]KAA8484048.1 hypothetical protein F1649_06790 [Arcticibacter tournemirensis]TQM51779.1 hypothetical protein BDE36_3568 [Arcticibacter tournemirensis]
MKLVIFIILLMFSIPGYSQQGCYVDKDSRIKKYQLDMVKFLVNKKEFSIIQEPVDIKGYSGKMFVYKTVELFPWSDKPNNPGILLVKFGPLGDHARGYWAILEADKSIFFLNTENDKTLNDYIKKYSMEIQQIIRYTLKLYQPYE